MWPITPNVTDSSRPRFDTFGYAIQAYERVRMNDPTGPLADSSLMALGNAYFRRGQYEDAARYYDMLRKEYPNSQHQMNAHILGLQAKMRMYQGTSYDETPLKESAKIARQTLTQFGAKLGDERQRIAQSEAMISEEQANREFTLGQYYEGRKFFGAARIYYKSVIDDFPTTRRAKEAQARLEAIRNEPDEPPGDFAWLTGMFGGKK
jgi:outer membrane protein assembly factor BamD (BamD/ComL family)